MHMSLGELQELLMYREACVPSTEHVPRTLEAIDERRKGRVLTGTLPVNE